MVRCAAFTKKGSRCKRKKCCVTWRHVARARKCTYFCWQHCKYAKDCKFEKRTSCSETIAGRRRAKNLLARHRMPRRPPPPRPAPLPVGGQQREPRAQPPRWPPSAPRPALRPPRPPLPPTQYPINRFDRLGDAPFPGHLIQAVQQRAHYGDNPICGSVGNKAYFRDLFELDEKGQFAEEYIDHLWIQGWPTGPHDDGGRVTFLADDIKSFVGLIPHTRGVSKIEIACSDKKIKGLKFILKKVERFSKYVLARPKLLVHSVHGSVGYWEKQGFITAKDPDKKTEKIHERDGGILYVLMKEL